MLDLATYPSDGDDTMKDGLKTSEFYTSWAAAIAAGGYGMDSGEPMVQAAGLLAAGIALGLYALGRGIAKGGGA